MRYYSSVVSLGSGVVIGDWCGDSNYLNMELVER